MIVGGVPLRKVARGMIERLRRRVGQGPSSVLDCIRVRRLAPATLSPRRWLRPDRSFTTGVVGFPVPPQSTNITSRVVFIRVSAVLRLRIVRRASSKDPVVHFRRVASGRRIDRLPTARRGKRRGKRSGPSRNRTRLQVQPRRGGPPPRLRSSDAREQSVFQKGSPAPSLRRILNTARDGTAARRREKFLRVVFQTRSPNSTARFITPTPVANKLVANTREHFAISCCNFGSTSNPVYTRRL